MFLGCAINYHLDYILLFRRFIAIIFRYSFCTIHINGPNQFSGVTPCPRAFNNVLNKVRSSFKFHI